MHLHCGKRGGQDPVYKGTCEQATHVHDVPFVTTDLLNPLSPEGGAQVRLAHVGRNSLAGRASL